METFTSGVIEGLKMMSLWEVVAVVLAIAYLLLAMRQNIWCWVAAFFSTLIYSVLFWDVALLMESALNVYYLIMAVYGWYCWRHGKNSDTLQVSSWGMMTHVKIIIILAGISAFLGYMMSTYTHADFAYVDATTTVFAVFTTYMVAQKVLENWLYWIVIDTVSIYLYINKEFYLTSMLFVAYCVLAMIGYRQWKVDYETRNAATTPAFS